MFIREQIVFCKGTLEDDTLFQLTKAIERCSITLTEKNLSLPVVVCITSPGGHLPSSYSFFEQRILFGPRDMETIALDDTSSAALFLYILGAKRFVAPHTEFFFHKFSLHINDYIQNIASACERIHITPEHIMALMTEKGTNLTATDALAMGLAQEMLSASDEKQLRLWRNNT